MGTLCRFSFPPGTDRVLIRDFIIMFSVGEQFQLQHMNESNDFSPKLPIWAIKSPFSYIRILIACFVALNSA